MGITKATDTQFEDKAITEVRNQGEDGWAITVDDGWSFFVPNNGVEPLIGDTARFYGDGVGRPVRGLDINGQEVFYRTPAQQEEKHQQDRAEQERRDKEEFEQKRESLDASYIALPKVFQQRLDRFRANNPDFRWNLEAYEMGCCVDAVKLAKACPTEAELKSFLKQDHERQRQMVPGLGYENHSGNSFGMVKRLAWLYVANPELVAKEHGALCPLMGCKGYGCVPVNEEVAA